jgi:hypothetical protein
METRAAQRDHEGGAGGGAYRQLGAASQLATSAHAPAAARPGDTAGSGVAADPGG